MLQVFVVTDAPPVSFVKQFTHLCSKNSPVAWVGSEVSAHQELVSAEMMRLVPNGIKVMADYGAWPLWDTGPTGPNNVNPAELPIPETLRARLFAWARTYDTTLNWDDPLSSPGFSSPDAHNAWVAQGRDLAQQLATALSMPVLYFDDLARSTSSVEPLSIGHQVSMNAGRL